MRPTDTRPGSWVTHHGSPVDEYLEAVTSALVEYAAAGVFGLEEHQVTAALLRIGGVSLDDPTVGDLILAIALAVRSPSRGHICVDLRTAPERLVVDGADGDALDALAWPEDNGWIELVAASPLVERTPLPAWADLDGEQRRVPPLILDESRLYLERYWRYESQVIAAVDQRATANHAEGGGGVTPSAIDPALLDDLLPLDAAGAPSRQRLAVTEALSRPASLIAGGPGTGKTYTIARLLALLVAGAADRGADGGRPPQIALAAPTGKAAARMTEALRQAVNNAGLDEAVADHLNNLTATTIHRLLGYDFDNPTRFRHDADRPLPHDVVVLDESSMVSLPLMAKLLDALSPRTRLVLVGDPDQLTSVEAGTVLGDLTHQASPLADAVVRLDRSHRFGEHSPIGELADALRRGDADGVRATLEAQHGAVTWVPVTASAWGDVPPELERLALDAAEGVYDAALEGDAQAAVNALGAIRLLCAHRRGGSGVEAWNERIAELLGQTRPGSFGTRGFAVGTPWLVTANDQANRLANGDAVVIIDSDGHPTGVLAGPELRTVPLSHLDAVEPFHAITIHKSQGSEFDHAVVILPPADSPILTRELLYTAVTRAKTRLTIIGEAEAIEQAVRRKTDRASGLIERWEAGRSAT